MFEHMRHNGAAVCKVNKRFFYNVNSRKLKMSKLQKRLFSLVWVCSLSAVQLSAMAQTGDNDQQLFTPVTLSAEQLQARNKSDDPKVNPKKDFESDFDTQGPISIEFADNHYTQTQHMRSWRNSVINQLGIVVKSQMEGRNIAKRVFAIIDATHGSFSKGGFDDNAKEEILPERLEYVINRAKLENPAMNDLPKEIDREVVEAFKNNPKLEHYDEDIYVLPRYWSLVFDDATKSETEALYGVRFAARISKPLENGKGGFIRAKDAFNIECQYASENKPLAEWQKNDYELIAVERKKALDNCIATIKPMMPKLLEIDTVSK